MSIYGLISLILQGTTSPRQSGPELSSHQVDPGKFSSKKNPYLGVDKEKPK